MICPAVGTSRRHGEAKTAESGKFFGVYPHLVGLGEMFLNILLALVAEEGDDRSQLGVSPTDFLRGDQVRTAAGSDEEPVLLGQATHALHGLFGIDGEGRVYQPPVALEDSRHEAV